MAEADIPDDVKRFLAEHIDSLFQLEVLLLLQARPDVSWTAEHVDRETRIGVESVKALLANFEQRGFLSVGPDLAYRYQPANAEVDRVIKLVATTYRERRVKVTSFIYASPLDSIRSFAEAFRIRKD